MTEFWNDVLHTFNKTSKLLQSVQIDLSTVVELYNSLVSYVKSVREMFQTYYDAAKEKFIDCNKIPEFENKQRKRKKHFDESNDPGHTFDSQNNFKINTFYVICDNLTVELNKRKSAYDSIISKYSFILKIYELDPSEIREDAKKLRTIYKQDLYESFENECVHFQSVLKLTTNPPKTLLDMSKFIKEKQFVTIFPYVDVALRMFLCNLASNCSIERSFSTLRRIKNYLRSSMSSERLNSLAVLNIEATLTKSLNYSDVIKTFAAKQARKKKLKLELILTRRHNDLNALTLKTGINASEGKIILKKIVWMVPHITVDDEKRLKFLKLIEKEKSLFIPFRCFENFEYPELGTTKKVVWNLKTSSKLEKPRFIIIGLQKGQSYYEKDIRNPILSPSTFLANVLIIVIDTSKQNTATASAVDVQLEIEASESLAGVTAYCLLIHDRIVEYVPFTRESVTEVQAIQTFSIRKSTLIKMWKIRKNIEDDEDLLMLGAGYIYLQQQQKSNNKRRFWVRPTLQKRNEHGVNKLLMNLQDDDVGLNGELRSSFKNFLRMSSHDFENQTNLLVQQLKKNNNWRCPISVTERLSLTLRFLATGDSYHSLMYQFRISTQSISLIVPEVCEAIINALSGYIKALLRFFHISNNDYNPGDRLEKIQPLVDLLNNSFKQCKVSAENLVIDETLVPFRGRIVFRQYIEIL
ncbi:hypothetical protein QTP88_021052 [Uroleucon formosanum]